MFSMRKMSVLGGVFSLALLTGCDEEVPGTVVVINDLSTSLGRQAACRFRVMDGEDPIANGRMKVEQGGFTRIHFTEELQDLGYTSIEDIEDAGLGIAPRCWSDWYYWYGPDEEYCDFNECDSRRIEMGAEQFPILSEGLRIVLSVDGDPDTGELVLEHVASE